MLHLNSQNYTEISNGSVICIHFFSFRACYGVLRFIMESGAKGCEVVVSGKLRGQRAKSMKFTDGLMIHSGDPMNDYVDMAVRHVLLRQGNINLCLSSKPLANDGNYTQ